MDAVQEFMRAALEGVKKENLAQPSREGSILSAKIEEAMIWRAHQRQVQIFQQRAKEAARAATSNSST